MKKNQLNLPGSVEPGNQGKNINMKKISEEDFLRECEELSMEETMGIIGGESLWYWMGYGLGRAANFI